MTPTPSSRDIDKLSAYLDGQLKPSEAARLEARLQTDPELAAVLKDLREARDILRQIPQRRAPRNFTLTPEMVGTKPPMPRTYPVFQYASVLATLLLFFTFATNFMAPRYLAAATLVPNGFVGEAEPEMAMEVAPADLAEPPALLESVEPTEPTTDERAAEPAMEEAVVPEEPAALGTPTPLATEGAATADDNARAEPTIHPYGVEKSAPADAYAQEVVPDPDVVAQAQPTPLIGSFVQIILASIAIFSAIIAFALRFSAIRKWRAKTK